MKDSSRRLVVAFGGNALLARGEDPSAENQSRHAGEAAAALGRLVRAGWRACVTHGNGPQVGLLALTVSVVQQQQEATCYYLLRSTGCCTVV